MRQKEVVILVLFSMITMILGCSIELRKNEHEKQLEGSLVVLLEGYWNGLNNYVPIKAKIDQFMKKHPQVKVDVQMTFESGQTEWLENFYDSFNQSAKPVNERVAVPNLVELSPNQMKDLYRKGKIINLNPYVEVGEIDPDKFPPALLRAVSSERKDLLGLPTEFNPYIVYYSKQAFDTLDLPYPDENWTWDQFAEYVKVLNMHGYKVIHEPGPQYIDTLVYGLQGAIASDSGNVIGYLDSETSIAALHWISDHLSYALESYRFDTLQLNEAGLVIATAYGFMTSDRNYLEIVTEGYKSFDIAPIPADASGNRRTTASLAGLSIPSESANQKLAWELLRFIANDEDPIPFILENTWQSTRRYFSPSVPSSHRQNFIVRQMDYAEPNKLQMNKAHVPFFLYHKGYNSKFDLGNLLQSPDEQSVRDTAQYLDHFLKTFYPDI